jgi:hypothetical protein
MVVKPRTSENMTVTSFSCPWRLRDSGESYLRNRLSDALRVFSARVLCESMVAIRTWNGSGSHSGPSPSEDLPG